MNFNTKTVLVTGAAGWLGTGLVNALANGMRDVAELNAPDPQIQVRALLLPSDDDSQLRKVAPNIDIVRGDVRNTADSERFCADAGGGILFHTAGIIHPHRVHDFYDVNLTGTKNVLSAACKAKVKRAVIVSSNSPCGVNPHPDHLFNEDSPFNPYMNYGRSKMLMEQHVGTVQKSGVIETVLIRAPWFYGPFQPPRQTLFFIMIRDGKAPIVGDGKNLRSMAYIDNLAQGLILAAIRDGASGNVYWIADERPYSMNEIIDTVERLLETEFGQTCAHKRMRLPSFASEVAWVADKTLQGLGLYHQKIHVLSEMNKTIACSVARARKELGYAPQVALEEGMRRSLKWVFETTGKL